MNITSIAYPIAKKKPHTLSIHGDTRVDNFYWLKDRKNPEVIEYLEAENVYRKKMMASTESFEKDLYEEIIGRIKQTDMSVPFKHNGYYYIKKFEEDKEYPIYSRKKESLEADEEIMLDVNRLAKGNSYFRVTGLDVSPDNRLLAFGEDRMGRRKYKIRILDLFTGEFLADEIENTTGGIAWANDNQTFYYTLKDASLRPYKVVKHRLGTNSQNDQEIYHEKDETFITYAYKTKSENYVIIGSDANITSEFQYLDANEPDGNFQLFHPRIRGLEYDIYHYEEHFYILCNLDAQNFRLMKTPVNNTLMENWQEVIAHREEVLLEDVDIFHKYLVLSERSKGLTQVRIIPFDGSPEHYIDFNDPAYSVYTSVNPEFDTEVLRLGFTSMTIPDSTYDYHMGERKLTLLKRKEIVGAYQPEDYISERLTATGHDGVEIPLSLVYKKDTKVNRNTPLLLYGYGSYGHSIDPYFSISRISLLDRGFIFAIAHIRGGEDLGRKWYEDGKLLNKKNTFYDFITCSEFLIYNNYTSPEHLFAMGGSAGGLLMGVVINLRPELFKGIIAAVPFVDVLTTMLDESIPLTTGEYDEWGNPNDPTYYKYIKSYSPYDQVEAKNYPAMLVTTGLHDSQVQYWEPAKWVAKLREFKTDDHLLLLYCNMEAGHSGATGRFQQFKETAMEFTFLLYLAGKVD